MLHFIHHGQVTYVPASIPCSTLPQYSPLAFITVRIRQASSLRWVTTIALIDCGAQGNFISPSFVEKHFLNQVPESGPLPVQMADGLLSRGGLVTHHAPVTHSNGFRARMYRVRGSARVRDDRVGLKMSKGRVLESLFEANQE